MATDSETGGRVYLVMSNPPELRACHVIEAWSDLSKAEERADEISFGYIKPVDLNSPPPSVGNFEIPAGVGIRVLVDGEYYAVDEFLEGDPVLRPSDDGDGVRRGVHEPTVEIHFVPPGDDIAELYTTDSERPNA